MTETFKAKIQKLASTSREAAASRQKDERAAKMAAISERCMEIYESLETDILEEASGIGSVYHFMRAMNTDVDEIFEDDTIAEDDADDDVCARQSFGYLLYQITPDEEELFQAEDITEMKQTAGYQQLLKKCEAIGFRLDVDKEECDFDYSSEDDYPSPTLVTAKLKVSGW